MVVGGRQRGNAGVAEVSPPAERETIFHHTIDLRANYARKLPAVRPLCEALGSLEKRKVSVEGAELYVEMEGQGIPLVLINGGPGGTHEGFHPEFSRAAGFARVIYYDQRGCGLSDYRKGAGYTVAQAVAFSQARDDARPIVIDAIPGCPSMAKTDPLNQRFAAIQGGATRSSVWRGTRERKHYDEAAHVDLDLPGDGDRIARARLGPERLYGHL